MMNSLFSSFDPTSSILNLNYLVMLLILAIPLTNKMFLLNSKKETLYLKLTQFLNSEMKMIINNKNLKDKMFIFISFFFTILLLNLSGLMPYIYSISSQLLFSLSLALPFWLSFILFSLKNSFQNFFTHLVPTGTPMALSHFMVLIESVSQLIRPITLSVRLAANITAGHILMILISNTIFFFNLASLGLTILFLLELAVAFIQSYVFTLLLVMYISETTYEPKP